MFRKEADYEAFARIMPEAHQRHPTRLLAWCVMRNHEHLLTVCRYVERNALTAHVVARAEAWRFSSLGARRHRDEPLKAILSEWPIERPKRWVKLVNEPMTEKEAEAVRTCIARNRPFGSPPWQSEQAKRLGLLHTLRSEGRPKGAAARRRSRN